MQIFNLEYDAIPIVSRFMAKLRPDWWNENSASRQLSAPGTIGWYAADQPDEPYGWLLCKDLEGYRCLEVDCLEYDSAHNPDMGRQLGPLFDAMERKAKALNYASIRYIIGSRGLSCHDRALGAYWQELRDLHAIDKNHFLWLLERGYRPAGFMPDAYGPHHHGVIMIKEIAQLF